MTEHSELDASPTPAKLRVKDFLLLAESGAFDRYPRTELIEGEIWIVNAIHRRHARVHAMLTVELGAALKAADSQLVLYTAPSTELSDDSMPEPDIALSDPTDDKILQRAALRLAIEIADSSLSFDLGRKARLYARHGVPEYWVVDIEAGMIHQMWAPAGEAYAERREVALGARIVAKTVDGLEVDTAVA